MQPSTDAQDVRDRYHFAKLALFNARLLGRFQEENNGVVRSILEEEAKRNGMIEIPSLLHQTTFLQFSYLCLVWLWESAKIANLEKALLDEFPKVAERQNMQLPDSSQIDGEREVKNWHAVIRLLRNALSHGRVKATDSSFEFSDQNTYEKNPEKEATTLTVSWMQLAQISESVIHSLTPALWPNLANPSVNADNFQPPVTLIRYATEKINSDSNTRD